MSVILQIIKRGAYNECFFNSLPLPLSDEETTKYFEMMKKGNKEAKNKLIEHNLRLVYYLALKYKKVYTQNFYFSVDDLMSIGSIGLIKAVTSFDQTKGASFATYASKGIELEILNYIRKHKNLDVSLHQSLSKDQDGHLFTIEDSLTSTSNIEKEYISKENYEELKPALKILTNEERKVIRLRYGNHKVSQEK